MTLVTLPCFLWKRNLLFVNTAETKMNEETISQLNEIIEELAKDGYFVTVLVTGKGNDLELTASPCRSLDLSKTVESAFLH